ncbi:iron ABC transporter permease [Verticiella sediminum]|uniref:Iron ABC transporter permease n=2 Tax=Verticiella sediminum TaxID=1247510 RepID=A0A556B271_9BURK|nr:iron ABC transporter permease [Verticiella sediminum]
MLLAALAGCRDAVPPPQTGYAGLGQAAGDYLPVERGRELHFPADHGAHDGYRIEWWYITANLTDETGRDWGVQWTLFRTALRPGPEQPGWQSPNAWMAHAAVTGPDGHRHAERLARGGIGQAGVTAEPFAAWIDDWRLDGQPGLGLDRLALHAAARPPEGGVPGFSYDLALQAQGPLILHGDAGYSEKSGQGQASYYYSQPFYEVQGEIAFDGQRHTVTGRAWLDREWSSQPLSADQQGWDWFSLHLADGAKLMVFQVRHDDGRHYRAGTWIAPGGGPGVALREDQIALEPLASARQVTGREVPVAWRVQVPEHAVDARVDAVQPQAWMGGTFPYWEGPVRIDGGTGGRGYLEMTGY